MARPRDAIKLRWVSRVYIRGYCECYRGVVYTRIGGVRRTTGLRWPDPTNPLYNDIRTEAERILDERIAAHYSAPTDAAQPTATATPTTERPPHEPQTIFELIAEFRRVKLTAKYTTGDHYQKQFSQSIRAFLSDDDDVPLTMTALINHYSRRIGAARLQGSTLAKYAGVHRRVLAYAVERGYLPSNPLAVITTPEPEKRMITLFPVDKLADLQRWSESLGDHEAALYWRWMYLTGMRRQESLDLLWEDVTDTALLIRGKGHRGEKRIRYIPLRHPPTTDTSQLATWEREIVAILSEMRMIARGVKVWRWVSPDIPTKLFLRGRKVLGLPDTVTLHTLRKAAEYHWEFDLGLDAAAREALAGHTIAVARKHYRGDVGAHEVSRLIDRAR